MKRPDAQGLELADLTVPRSGSTTFRGLWSQALRAAVHDLLSLRPPPEMTSWPAVRRTFLELLRVEPGALLSALRLPSVGTRVRCLRDPARTDIDRPSVFAALHAALADAIGDGWRGPTAPEVPFTSWSRRAARRGGRWVAQDDQGPLFVELVGSSVLCRADDSPLALHEAHPDKEGNRATLGGQPLCRWKDALMRAFELIECAQPPLYAELAAGVRQIVPVGFDQERHLSASFQENLGTIYASLHPQEMTMVEALVHEFSHNKLNALLDLDPILHNAFTPLYSSPVRPDPRPLHGVLLAVHAFAAVASVYAALRDSGHPLAASSSFDQRFAEINERNQEGLRVLQNADPTPVGKVLLDELGRLIHPS